jgi:hypothetical protein
MKVSGSFRFITIVENVVLYWRFIMFVGGANAQGRRATPTKTGNVILRPNHIRNLLTVTYFGLEACIGRLINSKDLIMESLKYLSTPIE